MSQPLSDAVDAVQQEAAELLRLVKPKLRGWLHLAMVPLTLAAAIVLIVLAPAGKPRIGAVVFGVTSVLLFTTSAIYHRGTWGPRVDGLLKRIDHSNNSTASSLYPCVYFFRACPTIHPFP